MLGRRVKQDPDAPAGVRQVAVATAEHQSPPAVGLRKPYEHPHRGGLAGTVGAEKATDGSGLAAERDARDDRAVSAALGEGLGGNHADTLAAAVAIDGRAVRRTAPTMAALTARIDTTPTHWRASPVPSPQYGFEGPTS